MFIKGKYHLNPLQAYVYQLVFFVTNTAGYLQVKKKDTGKLYSKVMLQKIEKQRFFSTSTLYLLKNKKQQYLKYKNNEQAKQQT